MDDQVGRISKTDQVEDSAFGQVQEELSVVMELPSTDASAPAGKTILVVDDEVEIRKMLTRLFVSRGYEVIEAIAGSGH